MDVHVDTVELPNGGYVYLTDRSGELIYHPRQQLIYSGLLEENNLEAAGYSDGSHAERFQGRSRVVTVKTVGYTGWKIIGVVPEQGFTLNEVKTRLFMAFVVAFFFSCWQLSTLIFHQRSRHPFRSWKNRSMRWRRGSLMRRSIWGDPMRSSIWDALSG